MEIAISIVLGFLLTVICIIVLYLSIGFTIGIIDRVLNGPDKKVGTWNAIIILTFGWGLFPYFYAITIYQKWFKKR